MKVIDLLNKIANGEETPKRFIFRGEEFYLLDKNCYMCDKTGQIFEECLIFEFLNKEIEIIEEKKTLKKLKRKDFLDNFGGLAINDGKFIDKINEIIDYIQENKDE